MGIVLLLAAALKSHQLIERPDSLAILGWIRHQVGVACLIQVELLLSLWLIVGGRPRARFFAAILCFCLFACAATFEAMRAMPSCGCFGNVKVPPAITAAFDVLAVVALWFTRPRNDSPPVGSPSRLRVAGGVIIAVLLSSALWAGYFVRTKHAIVEAGAVSSVTTGDDLIVLEPESWVGKPFSLFDEIDGAQPLREGHWVVVFYHYDCDSCLQAIPAYRAWAAESGRPHLAFVAMPPAAPAGQDPVADSSDYLHLSLRADHDWLATTPVVVALEDGKVIWAADGEQAVNPPKLPQWEQTR